MTARAGRKRRVPRPKRTAREQLVDALWYATHAGDGSAYRAHLRLLRAHERELAERADAAAIDALHANGMTPLADIGDAVRAAILGQPQARVRVWGGAR